MNNREYQAALDKLGLSQLAGARLLGVDDRTSRRWASGERPVPNPVERFLRFLIVLGMSGADAMARLR